MIQSLLDAAPQAQPHDETAQPDDEILAEIIGFFTEMPNLFLDHLGEYGDACIRVALIVARHTIGWHKVEDRISLSQFASDDNGLSESGARKGIAEALKKNLISRRWTPKGYVYRLTGCYKGTPSECHDVTPLNKEGKKGKPPAKPPAQTALNGFEQAAAVRLPERPHTSDEWRLERRVRRGKPRKVKP